MSVSGNNGESEEKELSFLLFNSLDRRRHK